MSKVSKTDSFLAILPLFIISDVGTLSLICVCAIFFISQKEADSTSTKSYLSSQIRLMTISTFDLLTDEECQEYYAVAGFKRQLSEPHSDRESVVKQKQAHQQALSKLIASHEHVPRTVNLTCVLDPSLIPRPLGVTWKTLKPNRRIAEFVSEESRAMGLSPNEITFDKIIVKWKSLEILKQIILNGFDMSVLLEDGTVQVKHYRFLTASAGQLRTDKVQFISDSTWSWIEPRIMCGLTWDRINELGGINTSKLMAYLALPCSATDPYDLDIDRCIVIDDFEAPVTGVMDYISPNYTKERSIHTVMINHCDGCGMMLPSVSRWNFMVRGPWLKGLLVSFDFIRFCEVNHCEAKLTDVWGLEHDLIAEDIQVIFTKSQLKLWKYYSSWQEYKDLFKACGCQFGRTNMEETFIPNSEMNYQFIQSLSYFPDADLKRFIKPTYDRIKSLSNDREHMFHALGADENSEIPYRKALKLYPELIREPYSREALSNIKKRWLLDARSGKIRCKNKRLFAIPDMYAACQHWFLHQAEPEGLLKNGEVYTRLFQSVNEVDVLRSPHLYFEHAIRSVNHDPEIGSWFYTNGIYTSCHDLISRILQFDVDGDQLNVVSDPILIATAKANIAKFDVVPLFYDATKAPPEQVNPLSLFNGVKRAHDYSGIGQISNALTRLWNRPKPDFDSAAFLCYFNNLTIDGAKTGSVNSYDNYPEVAAKINKSTGGQHGRMPHWFQYSKNGRRAPNPRSKKKLCAKANASTMNRLCALFDDIGHINMNAAGVPPFNGAMFLSTPVTDIDHEAVELFCRLDDSNLQSIIEGVPMMDIIERYNTYGFDALKELIIDKLTDLRGNLENVYPSIAAYLFTGELKDKAQHKQMFWRVFGDIALRVLKENLASAHKCPHCGASLPAWQEKHHCAPSEKGFFTCEDCGKWCPRTNSRQKRCPECQEAYRKESVLEHHKRYRSQKKGDE